MDDNISSVHIHSTQSAQPNLSFSSHSLIPQALMTSSNFGRLLVFLIILPSLSIASSTLPFHPLQSPSANQYPEDTICHGLTCYPRVFVPTHEFQVIHDDQEVPQGLHYRINIETGVREAKINVPGEGKDIEAATIELPNEGSRGNIFFVQQGNGKEERVVPNIKLKGSKAENQDEDGHGAIKPPPSIQSEQLTFTDSVHILLAGEEKHTPERIIMALNSLENLVHEIYWGLKISTLENISALLQIISTSKDLSIRRAAALVIGSALQNNPKALASAIGLSPVESRNTEHAADTKLIATLLSSLRIEPDPQTLSRLLYALNHSIKCPQTVSEFHSLNGLSTLHSLFQSTTSDSGDFKAKCATFIEDNFLNPDFEKDLDKEGKRIRKTDLRKQKVLGNLSKQVDRQLLSFCQPLQNSLVRSEQDGIFDDDVKSKMLSALVALRKKFGTTEKQGCPTSKDFLSWFEDQIDINGKSTGELEDTGEWFKLKALEFHEAGYFDTGYEGKKQNNGSWL